MAPASARGIRIQKDEGEEDDETAPRGFSQSARRRSRALLAAAAKMHSSLLSLSLCRLSRYFPTVFFPPKTAPRQVCANSLMRTGGVVCRETAAAEQLLYARMDSI